MLNVAITGGIAEGKSTVAGYLRGLGLRTASADDVARQVFESVEVQARLAEMLQVQGPVTPPDLREHLWENSRLRRSVNSLMHPLILERLNELRADAIEIPLLIETCLQGHFRQVWVVTCGPEEQRTRLRARMGEGTDLDAILASQLPTEVKVTFGDVIVRTNRPPDDVIRFITAVARRTFG
jgi:dephospho-CoA kinase